MTTPLPDLAPITRHLRAKASSQLLVTAIFHLDVFEKLSGGPLSFRDLQDAVQLKERPAMVLFPALCAMGLTRFNSDGNLELSETGKHLTSSCSTNLIGYAGLEKDDPGVLHLTQWLRNDGPEDASQGLSYVKDEHAPSPMDDPEAARYFTMALAGRARYLSPVVAGKMTNRQGHLLDVACGTGYYSYEWLLVNPGSRVTVMDRPEVLKVASEILEEFCNTDRPGVSSVKDRVNFLPGDMLADPLPEADIVLAASLFHDWPVATCEILAKKFASALTHGGELWIHDAFLDDSLDGPIAVTDYSAMLFLGTKGRAYSRKEYRNWMTNAGLRPVDENIPTLMDYGLISAVKS